MDWQTVGRMLIGLGMFIVITGTIIFFLGKLFNIGNLPGDIVYKKEGFTFYFPVVSSILLSLILTILLNFIFRR